MKRSAAFLAAVMLCASMTACSAGGSTEETAAPDVSETAGMTEVSEETEAETASEAGSETEGTTAGTEAEEKAENAKFVDFAFIEDHRGTKDIGELADKAIEFVGTTNEYSDSQARSEVYSEKYPEFYEDGVLVPQLHEAYPDDYDGDGKTETFMLVDIPYALTEDSVPSLYSVLIFADSEGELEKLGLYTRLYDTELIDYGYCRQLVTGGSGTCGAEDHKTIWGVRDGKPDELYTFRGSLYKQDCFVSAFGWQSMGGVMWFDPDKLCYVPVPGSECDIDVIREMDSDGNIAGLEEYDPDNENMLFNVTLIGGKYYCVENWIMDFGTIYTYDGEKFAPSVSYLRTDHLGLDAEPLIDFDYDEMLSEMTEVRAKLPVYSIDDLDENEVSDAVTCYLEYIGDGYADPEPDDVRAYYYLGVHSGYPVFAMGIPDLREDDLPGRLIFGDEKFAYNDGNLDIVLCSEFGISTNNDYSPEHPMCMSVEEAYKKGILTDAYAEQIKELIADMGV